jgi:hypothetical protein
VQLNPPNLHLPKLDLPKLDHPPINPPQINPKNASFTLWAIQGMLAGLFLFAGGFKLMISSETLAHVAPLPVLFLRFIGVCEVTGALGLILPGLFRIRTDLTPLAAAGLTLIMIGATIVTVFTLGVGATLLPLTTGILAALVAYGRWRIAPLPAAVRTEPRERPERASAGVH